MKQGEGQINGIASQAEDTASDQFPRRAMWQNRGAVPIKLHHRAGQQQHREQRQRRGQCVLAGPRRQGPVQRLVQAITHQQAAQMQQRRGNANLGMFQCHVQRPIVVSEEKLGYGNSHPAIAGVIAIRWNNCC
ncbi:hypothetical protein Q668_16805 [Alcanivorax sp. PN-3]|nr:hypothetical protein Q668_16805 [Alcanivorax sp. PN-3]CUR44630.1 hypothetical protein BN2364_0189 [Alloalcanivorax xenomutans]